MFRKSEFIQLFVSVFSIFELGKCTLLQRCPEDAVATLYRTFRWVVVEKIVHPGCWNCRFDHQLMPSLPDGRSGSARLRYQLTPEESGVGQVSARRCAVRETCLCKVDEWIVRTSGRRQTQGNYRATQRRTWHGSIVIMLSRGQC